MPYIPNEALTREQGEQIIDVLKGEEPKEYGYPYTNEVLNKEQGDRIIKALKNFKDSVPTPEAADVGKVLGIVQEEGTIKYKPVEGGSGGGLPDPSELETGTAPVVVDGQWKMQEGYGWVGEELEKATSLFPMADAWYRVADVPELPSDFGLDSYCTIKMYESYGGEPEIEYYSTQINYAEDGIFSCIEEEIPYYAITTEDNVSIPDSLYGPITFGTAGVYFRKTYFFDNIINQEVMNVFTSGIGFGNNTREMVVTWDGVTKTGKKIDVSLLPDGICYEEPSKLASDIYWDGDTQDRDVIFFDDYGIDAAYKVSEYIDPSSFIGAEFTKIYYEDDEYVKIISQEDIFDLGNGVTYIGNAILTSEGPTEIDGLVIPSGGVYFEKYSGDYNPGYVSSVTGNPIIHKIGYKYLPEIIPWPEESDAGKVLTADEYGGLSWKSGPGFIYYRAEEPSSSKDGDIWIEFTPKYLCFTALENNSSVGMTAIANAPSVSLEYSLDRKIWQSFIVDETTIDLDAGEKVYFRGNNNSFSRRSFTDYNKFVMSGKIKSSGSIMTVFDYNNEALEFNSLYACCSMFRDCTSLVTAPELPATTLASNCYDFMFCGCTSLVTAPELPATTLEDHCYYSMFRDCTSLVTAPELPATTLSSNCYDSMFYGCTSLVTAPELPATTLVDGCYNLMFSGCTSLVTAPELPATTLVDDCYDSMFYGCTSLNYIEVAFVNWLGTYSWLPNNVGTFTCPAALDTSIRDEDHIPSNWNIVTV